MNQVSCTCGECEQEGNYYICVGCKRSVPWCFGAADEYFDYCDDCAVELDRGKRRLQELKVNEFLLGDK